MVSSKEQAAQNYESTEGITMGNSSRVRCARVGEVEEHAWSFCASDHRLRFGSKHGYNASGRNARFSGIDSSPSASCATHWSLGKHLAENGVVFVFIDVVDSDMSGNNQSRRTYPPIESITYR